MRRGHWIALAGLAALAAVGAAVSTSSAGGGGGGARYTYQSGPFFVDQGSLVRVMVHNASARRQDLKLKFFGVGATVTQALELDPGEVDDATGLSFCQPATCLARAEIRAKTPLLAPTVRYQNADAAIQERGPGDWIVVHDGKRVF